MIKRGNVIYYAAFFILAQFWLQWSPVADLNGDNRVDFADYAIVCRIAQGDIWVTKYEWLSENVFSDGSSKVTEGWTYTVWDNKPEKNDPHPDLPGFVWVDAKADGPIMSMNYIFFEQIFPDLVVDGTSEPVYFESLTQTWPAPTILQWEIAATHGSDIGELWCPIEDGYVEPRSSGITKLRIWFDRPMEINRTESDAISIYGENDSVQPYACTIEWDGSYCMVISFCSALPDGDTYTITVSNSITSAIGYVLNGDRSICITSLKGDANTSYAVNSQDLLAISAHLGESVNCDNVRFDINCSGQINSQDVLAARAYAGNTAVRCTPANSLTSSWTLDF